MKYRRKTKTLNVCCNSNLNVRTVLNVTAVRWCVRAHTHTPTSLLAYADNRLTHLTPLEQNATPVSATTADACWNTKFYFHIILHIVLFYVKLWTIIWVHKWWLKELKDYLAESLEAQPNGPAIFPLCWLWTAVTVKGKGVPVCTWCF
jgi:hypothetical protein